MKHIKSINELFTPYWNSLARNNKLNKEKELKDKLYTVTVLTKEGLERHKDKTGIEQENFAGYHFSPKSKSKCIEQKQQLESEGTYNNEEIIKVKIYPASAGMGNFR